MDPMDLQQLLYVLSALPEHGCVARAEDLHVGQILATGPFDRHVVVRAPIPSPRMVTLTIRSLHGGHTLTLRRNRTTVLPVYTERLSPGVARRIPDIPRAHIPARPAPGDRIAYVARDNSHLGVSRRWIYDYDGSEWRRDGQSRYPTDTIRDNEGFCSMGYFVLLPAGHRPYLYVDGRPVPARAAWELRPGDVLLEDDGGRHRVDTVHPYSDSTEVIITVLRLPRSPYPTRAPIGATVGERLSYTSSHGALFPCEPRPEEMLDGREVEPGDTLITTYGAPISAVSTVEDVHEITRPDRRTVTLKLADADGRPRAMSTSPSGRFVLLHRPPPSASFAA